MIGPDIAITICAGSSTFFVFMFGFLAFLRYLRHREIMMLAEKGLAYPESRNGKDTLRWGIVTTAVGLALIVGLIPVAWGRYWPVFLFGLIPTFFGLGLILTYVLTRENGEGSRGEESEITE